MDNHFFKQIKEHSQQLIARAVVINALPAKPRVIIGLSGGPDSVFLFHVLKDLHDEHAIELIAAHLDHGWRSNSAEDALFCSQMCLHSNIICVLCKAKELDVTLIDNGSLEDMGRQLRRFFFKQTQNIHEGHLIAIAHHLNDQQETFFLRLARGSTLNGLHGMDEIEGSYIRPLLNTNKHEIIHFLNENAISYRIDQTNESDNYLRNRIRKYVIPALQQSDSRFNQKFQSTIRMLKEEDSFLQKLAQKTFHEVFCQEPSLNKSIGNLKLFRSIDPILQRRIIIIWLVKEKIPFSVSTNFINEIIRFLQSQNGGTHRMGEKCVLHKKQHRVWIEKYSI